MKKFIAILLSLLCIPAAAQNYLRDDGTFHSVVEGTTAGQVLINSGGLLAGTDVFNGGISPDGRGSPACVRGGVVDCTSGVVAAAAAANAAGVPLRLLVGGGYCIRPIQFGGSSPPSGMTLAALPYGISTESAQAAFVSCAISPTGTALVRIVNYAAGNTINQNFTMGPLLIDGGVSTSYALEIYGSIYSNITATLRRSSVASFYVHADTDHVVIDNSWNISFDSQTPAISALMQTTDGAANGIALAANRCVISNPFGSAAGDVVKTDYMNDGCTVDAESAVAGYGVNLGHMTSGTWFVHTEGNALGGVNGTVNTKGVSIYGSSQDGVAAALKVCTNCVVDVWNNTSSTQERNLGDAVSQSIYVKGLPAAGVLAPSSGQGWMGSGPTNGLAVAGNGSANDFVVLNSTAATGCNLPHNSAIWNCSGYQVNGAATLNHIMLGDGTAYRDSATLPVSVLASSSTTVNGQTCTLGSSCTVTAAASGVTVGTTTIGSGTTGRVLYDNAGVLGEYTAAQLTAQINAATAVLSGALPAWPNNTTTFFRGDGTYTAVGTTALTGTLQAAQEPAHTGDVTNTAGSLALTLAAGNAGNLNSGTLLAARMPALTGDVTTSAGAVATTLATVNSNVGTFGSATSCVTVTNNAKGLTTAISAATCTPAFSSITGQATLAQFPNMAANTALVNATAGSAVPTAFAMPSCSTAASALIWTTSTGFGCNTAITASTMPTTGLTGTLQAAQEPAHTGDVTNTAGSLALTLAAGNAGNLNSGTLLAARMPALTGDVTTSAGAVATTIAANAVTNAKLATMVTNTVKGNATSGTAVPTDLSMTSCSTASSAVIWTTNTGFGCNTVITAAAVPASGLTGATLASGVTASSLTSLGTITSLTATTINAFTLGGTISGVGNQINNVIIGTTTPLAGSFTTLTVANGSTTQGITFKNSGGTADVVIYEGGANALGVKLGTANIFNITKNDNSSIIDYGATTAGDTLTFTPNLLYWAGSTTDSGATDASVCRRTSNGQLLTGTGTLGICLGTSSARFKHDIAPMGAGLDELVRLAPKNFFYNEDVGDGGKRQQYGFLAEDVVKVLPGVTAPDENGEPQSVDMLAMVPILVKAVQELNATIKKLEAKIEEKK